MRLLPDFEFLHLQFPFSRRLVAFWERPFLTTPFKALSPPSAITAHQWFYMTLFCFSNRFLSSPGIIWFTYSCIWLSSTGHKFFVASSTLWAFPEQPPPPSSPPMSSVCLLPVLCLVSQSIENFNQRMNLIRSETMQKEQVKQDK